MRFANALAWHAEQLASAFCEAGHEVCLLCMRGSPLAERTRNAPYTVNRALLPTSANPLEVASCLRELNGVLRDFRPDVLNPHCSPGHTYLALLGGRRNLPLVRTVAEPRAPRSHWLSRRLYQKQTTGLIFTSESSRQRFESALGAFPAQAETVLPGFGAEKFLSNSQAQDLRTELQLTDNVLLLGVIARMSPEKGQEVLIDALATLSEEERSRLFVVLAGEDSRERGQAELIQLATCKGVCGRMHFYGRLSDVRPLMRALDVGVITSTSSEAICRVALEYMSCGLPVISSDTNILPEVVLHERTGYVYRRHDASELAGLFRRLLSNREEGVRFGKAGLARLQAELAIKREVERYLELFGEATHLRRRNVS